MRYIKKVLEKNKAIAAVYIGLGIGSSFLTGYKDDYFQGVIDGLAEGTLALREIAVYGIILAVYYCMNYWPIIPRRSWSMGFTWILNCLLWGRSAALITWSTRRQAREC